MRLSYRQFVYTWVAIGVIATLSLGSLQRTSLGDEPKREGPWKIERESDGLWINTAEMTIYPAAEPRPALQHRLIPDQYDQVEGNAALYYLKALGFLEQSVAAKRIQEFRDKNRKLADERGEDYDAFPPYSWLDKPPQQLPLAEVKEYLSLTGFQPPLLAEAARRSHFSLDRDMRNSPSPIATLLPEIQQMRELARLQSLRCRVAMAEQRLADAITILHQQFAMAAHLGNDEFLVSNLVGAAVLGIALQDMVYLLQDPKTPNLYWAFSSLPTPLIDMRRAFSLERQFFNLQLSALRDVDETTRPAGYWQDFVDRIVVQLRELELYTAQWSRQNPQIERAMIVSAVAAAYPGAKRYLVEQCQMDRAQVEAYPTAQVVFLAMKRFNQHTTDDVFKWLTPPYHQVAQHPQFQELSQAQQLASKRLGWASAPTDQLLLGSVASVRSAQARAQQQLGLLQTIEAIRMYAANNAGKLPATLADLPYPVPDDPVTGKPFQYEIRNHTAWLSGTRLPHVQYRFQLSIAK